VEQATKTNISLSTPAKTVPTPYRHISLALDVDGMIAQTRKKVERKVS
jgi:hypothetical protein